jgi:hypothetical protein
MGICCRISDDPEAVGRVLTVRRRRVDGSQVNVAGRGSTTTSRFTGVKRPAYSATWRHGRLAAIVTWDADRLHRSIQELEDFIDLNKATCTTAPW